MTKEFEIFEAIGDKTACVAKMTAALKFISHTTVETEKKAFSAVGLYITRLRTRLSDKSVNCLSFLRAYFKSN